MNTIFKYEWMLFIRNRAALIAWLIMLLIGLYAIYYGHSFHTIQLSTINRIDTAYQNRIRKITADFSADTTIKENRAKYRTAHDPFMNEYYTRPMIWKQPHPLQAMTIGQSDNQPFYYNLWVYNNVYNTKQVEIRNPAKLLAGNFDLAFVIIYLFPLLLIAICYNLLSADREGGMTGLLAVQGMTMRKIVTGRLLFRGLIAYGLITLLSIAGFAINGVKDAYHIVCWLVIALVYIVFWMALIYAVIAANKSSSVTALLLVSCWVMFLLIVPSLINNLQRTEDAGRVSIADADREFSNTLWEMDRKAIVDTLLKLKPSWKKATIRDTNVARSIAYSYLDMLNMNRIGRKIDSAVINEQQRLAAFNFINPASSAQLLFNRLAGSEIDNFVSFRESASEYQLQRSDKLNEIRINDQPFGLQEYKRYPVFIQRQWTLSASQLLLGALPLMLLSLISIAGGRILWSTKLNKQK